MRFNPTYESKIGSNATLWDDKSVKDVVLIKGESKWSHGAGLHMQSPCMRKLL